MTAAEKILRSLRTGEENGLPLTEVIRISGLDNRTARLVIEAMRRDGVVICASERGYFYPATHEELRRYVQRELRRAYSVLDTIKFACRALDDMEAGNENG